VRRKLKLFSSRCFSRRKIDYFLWKKKVKEGKGKEKIKVLVGKRKPKLRITSTYKSRKPGKLLQLDTLVKFELGIKRYILTAIDLYSKFSFAFAYKSLSSEEFIDSHLDFLEDIQQFKPNL